MMNINEVLDLIFKLQNGNVKFLRIARVLFVYPICIFLLISCASIGREQYKNTVYEWYSDTLSDKNKELKNTILDIYKDQKNPSLHYRVAILALNNKDYGLALFAFNEVHILIPDEEKVNYNIGVLFGLFGYKEAARAKLLYTQYTSANLFIKNRCTKALFELDENKKLSDGNFITY